MLSLLTSIADFVEEVAYLGAGIASFGALYQPKKPDCLIDQEGRTQAKNTNDTHIV